MQNVALIMLKPNQMLAPSTSLTYIAVCSLSEYCVQENKFSHIKLHPYICYKGKKI